MVQLTSYREDQVLSIRTFAVLSIMLDKSSCCECIVYCSSSISFLHVLSHVVLHACSVLCSRSILFLVLINVFFYILKSVLFHVLFLTMSAVRSDD